MPSERQNPHRYPKNAIKSPCSRQMPSERQNPHRYPKNAIKSPCSRQMPSERRIRTAGLPARHFCLKLPQHQEKI
ncbi:hypothetical protein [Neisseria meningitidis]|nr:hypothetical protein [Neisseria meningitidis]